MGGDQSKIPQTAEKTHQGKQWVLLAAGSKDWTNYRHQANVCHAYQMVHHNGIPDEQIVVMMYDDIAYNAENPYKGEIINVPGGPNVYPGVLKDYTELDVSASNFLAVLRGDEAGVNKQRGGPKKVLNSDENDTIFVYLSDHGGSGVFIFPKDTLHACDLLDTITEMSMHHKFSKMVIYIESCHSGSMMEGLPRDTPVYGVSACKPDESHYAYRYDIQRNTYLTGEFSYHWLRHCNTSDLTSTTFQEQYDILRQQMNRSTPCQYGNSELSTLFLSYFLVRPDPRALYGPANLNAGRADSITQYGPADLNSCRADSITQYGPADLNACRADSRAPYRPAELNAQRSKTKVTQVTPSNNVILVIYQEKIRREKDPKIKKALQRDYIKLLETRAMIEKAVRKIAEHSCPVRGRRALKDRRPLTRLHDMKNVAEHFRSNFSEWHDEQDVGFILSHMQVFVNLFESGVKVARIKEAITHVRSLPKFQSL
ncbi:legumain-like [Salminus brasiliensis]|uniref:legumain-like n=1 Tax=Salminus brasiliensis TaxID=930266 RepID=UPI003B8349B0